MKCTGVWDGQGRAGMKEGGRGKGYGTESKKRRVGDEEEEEDYDIYYEEVKEEQEEEKWEGLRMRRWMGIRKGQEEEEEKKEEESLKRGGRTIFSKISKNFQEESVNIFVGSAWLFGLQLS